MTFQTSLFFGLFLVVALAIGAMVLRKSKKGGVEAASRMQKIILAVAVLIAMAYTWMIKPQPTVLWKETPEQVFAIEGDDRYALSDAAIARLEEAALQCFSGRRGINRTMGGPVTLESGEGETLVVLCEGMMRKGVRIYKGDFEPLLTMIREEKP